MIFLPRETPEGEFVVEDKSLIEMDVRQLNQNAYDLTSPIAQELSDYQPILEMALEVSKPEDRLYLGVEWGKKRRCLLIITRDIDTKLKHMEEKGLKADCRSIGETTYELTSDIIIERTEFEGIADLMVECVADVDAFYLGYDWRKKRNAILWLTNQPDKRQECITGKGISIRSPSTS